MEGMCTPSWRTRAAEDDRPVGEAEPSATRHSTRGVERSQHLVADQDGGGHSHAPCDMRVFGLRARMPCVSAWLVSAPPTASLDASILPLLINRSRQSQPCPPSSALPDTRPSRRSWRCTTSLLLSSALVSPMMSSSM